MNPLRGCLRTGALHMSRDPNPTEPLRSVGYFRYSSEMQRDNWTIAAQRHEYAEHVEFRGWQSVGEYIDEARRASSDDVARRPAFQRMLEDIAAHRFDVVVVHE